MNEELLRAAQHGLRIDDIALRESQTWLADTYEPKYDADPANLQHYCAVRSSQLIELSNGNDAPHRKIFRVFVGLGVRWVRPPEPPTDQVRDVDDAPIDPSVLARIEATFVAEYALEEDLAKDALNEFALYNAPWHVWPYWREYVASQCARLNLSKVAMPMQFSAVQSRDEDDRAP